MLLLQDIKKVPEDIKELKPTLFVGVPRVFDRLTTGKLGLLMKITSVTKYVNFVPNCHLLEIW